MDPQFSGKEPLHQTAVLKDASAVEMPGRPPAGPVGPGGPAHGAEGTEPRRTVCVKMAVVTGMLAACSALAAAVPAAAKVGPEPALFLLFLWPAAVFTLFFLSYLLPNKNIGVRLFAKRDDGSLSMVRVVALAPCFVLSHLFWVIKQVCVMQLCVKEHAFDYVAPGIAVGRFPLRYPSEFPPLVKNVIDLTAEFAVRPGVARGRRYVTLPCMDCELPSGQAMMDVAREAASWDGDIYVHCANGHGRSASVAALIMVVRGVAPTWREAFAVQRRVRRVSVQPQQAAVLDALTPQLLEARRQYERAREDAASDDGTGGREGQQRAAEPAAKCGVGAQAV